MSQFVIQTTSVEQTVQLGEAIGKCCKPGDIIALQGELGAGKTQLVRGIAQGLGLNPRQVSSPTFVMVQEYERPEDQQEGDKYMITVLVHIDAYRIGSPDELESIGWTGQGEELRENAVVAIEWATLIGSTVNGPRVNGSPGTMRRISTCSTMPSEARLAVSISEAKSEA